MSWPGAGNRENETGFPQLLLTSILAVRFSKINLLLSYAPNPTNNRVWFKQLNSSKERFSSQVVLFGFVLEWSSLSSEQ